MVGRGPRSAIAQLVDGPLEVVWGRGQGDLAILPEGVARLGPAMLGLPHTAGVDDDAFRQGAPKRYVRVADELDLDGAVNLVREP